MSKHTPGPWVLDAGISSNVVLIDSKATNGAVGEIVDCRNRADAVLIAAAPDLYDALENVREQLLQLPKSLGYDITAITVIDAALAKARGEQ